MATGWRHVRSSSVLFLALLAFCSGNAARRPSIELERLTAGLQGGAIKQAAMTERTLPLLIATLLLTGCDAWFFGRMEVTSPEGQYGSFAIVQTALPVTNPADRLASGGAMSRISVARASPGLMWAGSTQTLRALC
jgi:hypothetical protein